MKSYKIEFTSDHSSPLEQRTYPTLTAARAALRKANGGRLYGKFSPEGEAVEGWNFGRNEGCDSGVIVEVACCNGGTLHASNCPEVR